MRVSSSTFNVTFKTLHQSLSRLHMYSKIYRTRGKINQSRRTRIRGQRGGIEKRVVERALRESASARVCGERIF